MPGAACPLPLVILAGGQSRRMGRDKALVAIAGTRMIDRIIWAMHGRFAALWLAAPHDYGSGLPIIADWPTAPGPVGAIAGIAMACAQHRPAFAAFLTMPVDAPLLRADSLAALAAAGPGHLAADAEQWHPTIGCWPVAAIRSLCAQQALPRSLHGLAETLDARRFTAIATAELTNVNRPADLAAVAALLPRPA